MFEDAVEGTKGSSVDRESHRGELQRASTCSSGKGGRPGEDQETDSSDYQVSFREEARLKRDSSVGTFSCSDRMVLAGSYEGPYMTHMQTLAQCN